MRKKRFWMGRAVCAAVVCASLVSAASADVFGTGANQFTIDFVTISGATNPTSGWGIVPNDYRIGVYEVTNDQWGKFVASLAPVTVTGTPSTAYDASPYWTGPSIPTSGVSWLEAAQFVNWLNTSSGHQPAYQFTGTQGTSNYKFAVWTAVEAAGGTNLYRHKDAFYYLPTEDEWVKAAYWNGTSLQTYANASASDLVSGVPDPTKWNYESSAGSQPWPVGSGSLEINGTYDMMGNLSDWLESPYVSGNYTTDAMRGLFGGCYNNQASVLASGYRDGRYGGASSDGPTEGFRVASEVPEPATLALLALGGGLALIRRRRSTKALVAVLALISMAGMAHTASADVFNMGGTRNPDGSWTGLACLETARVGNPGNEGELSGSGAGGQGPDRICGAVDYAYNIGKYEVTAGQYTEFLNKVAGVDTCGLYSSAMWSGFAACRIERYAGSGTAGNPYQYRVDASLANRPVNYVSWGDAARFANWLHNGQPTGAQDLTTTEDGAYFLNGATSDAALLAVSREADWKWAITSEDEWYKAAYHKNDGDTGNYFDYPTSNDTAPGRDLNDVSGNNANFHGHPYPIHSSYYTTVAGEFQNSDSPYGTFDQGGNLWEWTEGIFSYSPFIRCIRGAGFGNLSFSMGAGSRGAGDDSAGTGGASIGFRVVQVPEPATMALLALGGLAVIRRRRTA